MISLSRQLLMLKNFIPDSNVSNPDVSSTTIGWQIAHSLQVVNAVTGQLTERNPADYSPRFNILKYVIILSGYIPRGKGKSPSAGIPKRTDIDYLEELLVTAVSREQVFKTLDINAHFDHPLFGHLNRNTTLRFLQIHTWHHLKIIKDILHK